MTFRQELALVLLAAPFLLAAAFLRAPEALDRLDPLPSISGRCFVWGDGMRNAYRLLKDRFGHKAGTIVFEFRGCDYGLVDDDIAGTGRPHIAVALEISKGGGDTFFTVPTDDIERVPQ